MYAWLESNSYGDMPIYVSRVAFQGDVATSKTSVVLQGVQDAALRRLLQRLSEAYAFAPVKVKLAAGPRVSTHSHNSY